MKDFYNYINSITPVSEKTWKDFKSILSIKEYKSGEHLCSIGSHPELVCFLVKGYARGYVIDHKGKEFNREIFGPKEFMSSLSSLMLKEESKLGIHCMTDCSMFCANYLEFMTLTKKHPELEALYVKALEDNFIKLEQRTIVLSTMNATERYVALRKRIPRIDNHISQYHIASHLGITPIQLSRIRKELFSSK